MQKNIIYFFLIFSFVGGSLSCKKYLDTTILNDDFKKCLGKYRTAFASGWMQTFSPYGRGGYDDGFVMSDHADWNDLNQTIIETGAKRVFVQHRNGTLIRHLRKRGIEAHSDEALILENYDRLGGQEMSLF